jgi:hypothetical protein
MHNVRMELNDTMSPVLLYNEIETTAVQLNLHFIQGQRPSI